MRVLFLLLYHPEPHESSNLYADLVNEFTKNGHEVVVVSAAKEGNATTFKKENDVAVLRVKTKQFFNVHPVAKGIATLLLPFRFKKAIIKFLSEKKFDLILAPTPPITFVDVISYLKKKYKVKSLLILRDIFPQNARDLGMMSNPLIFNYFRKKEKKLYRYSDFIGCMSQGNIDYVVKHNPEVNPEKLFLLPNWQKAAPILKRDKSIKERYGLADRFVAIFGGNIGEPQKIENIVTLAQQYRENNRIVFLIIGSGARKSYLEQLVARCALNNVVINDSLPRSDYEQLVANADIGLISLSEKFTIPNIPSKTLSYFNAKIPVLAVVDANTDYGKLLEDAGAGLWSVTGDLDSYKRNFEMLYNSAELRNKMGENGYVYLIKYLTVEIAYLTIISKMDFNSNN